MDLKKYCLETESFVRSTMASVLRKVMSRTDTNAYVGRGQMFVFSSEQLEQLLILILLEVVDLKK